MATLAILCVQNTLRFVDIFEKIGQFCKAQALIITTLVATGTVTMLPSPLSPLPAVVSNPHQGFPDQAKLACIDFLQRHLEHGGLSRRKHNVLYRMIEMISACGWEVHVMAQSDIARPGALADIDRFIACILRGCSSFNKRIRPAGWRAHNAVHELPDLQDVVGSDLEKKVAQWNARLR